MKLLKNSKQVMMHSCFCLPQVAVLHEQSIILLLQ